MIINKFNSLVSFDKLHEISKKTGVAIKTLENLYNEKSESINFSTLNKICKELKLKSVQEIIQYTPEINYKNKFAPENEGIVWVDCDKQHMIDHSRPGHWEQSEKDFGSSRDIWVYTDIEFEEE